MKLIISSIKITKDKYLYLLSMNIKKAVIIKPIKQFTINLKRVLTVIVFQDIFSELI